MKVKIISFILMLLMVVSIMPMTVVAAEHTHEEEISNTYAVNGIMCNDTNNHTSNWYICQYCNTWVCSKCYSTHTHSNTFYCSTHKNVAYTYCSYCNGYYCTSCYGGYHSHGTTAGYCSIHKNVAYTYCSYCYGYYCTSCYGGYHSHSTAGYNSPFWCTNHSTYVSSSYCTICGYYYCATCYGAYHNHSYYYGEMKESYFVCKKHSIDVGASECSYCGYYYCTTCYGGYHYHGGSSTTSKTATCSAPTANVANNAKVEYGAKITLSTDTSNATIYYTTDGTVPTIYSNKYTGAITLTKDTTIKAIAVRNGYVNSSTSTYKYYVKSKVSFSDISDYPGLSDYLSTLVSKKVISDSEKFNPSAGFTFDELDTWLSAIGINLDKVKGIDHLDTKDNLSYNDFVYVLYKSLRSADYIKSPKGSGYETLKKFTYSSKITNASFYKAGYVSFYENGLFYDLNFNPESDATRAYLATAIAAVINNNNL